MRAPFASLVRRGLSAAVRGEELRQRRQHLLGGLLGDPLAVASYDRVQAQLTGVDVPARERVGDPAGRFDAPETEPGPSGVDRRAEDELVNIPSP
jgi:hypothetical protein